VRMRQVFADPAGRLNEINTVIVVLLNAGGHRKDVRIEDDVFRRETDLFGKHLVGPCTDFRFARERIGLALFVKGHNHDRCAVTADQFRLLDKGVFPLLERDGIDDSLALNALETGFDNRPLGTVNHHRNARYVRFRGNQIEERHHCIL